MIEIMGFWVGVTIFSVLPLYILYSLFVRFCLSYAKRTAPLNSEGRRREKANLSVSSVRYTIYPQWLDKIYKKTCVQVGSGDPISSLSGFLTSFYSALFLLIHHVEGYNMVETVINMSYASQSLFGWITVLIFSTWLFFVIFNKVNVLLCLLGENDEKGS